MQPWPLLRKGAGCRTGLLRGIQALQTGLRQKRPKGLEQPQCAHEAYDYPGNCRSRTALAVFQGSHCNFRAMNGKPWILFDTETTGLAAPLFVVELAAQRMRGWTPDGEPFRKLLNQNADIPA